jgi:hypothetical protein
VVAARRARAVAVISLAALTVISVSIRYLTPPSRAANPVPAPVIVTGESSTPSAVINLTGRTDGGYFVWDRPRGGSGGHAG